MRHKALVFFRHIPLLFTAQEADFPEVSVCLKNQSWTGGFPGSSAGKESACNAGDPCLIPVSGRSPGEGKGYPLQYSWASLVARLVDSSCNARGLGSIPGLSLSPGGGHGNPLQYSCLKNPHGKGSRQATVHDIAKSGTRLRD